MHILCVSRYERLRDLDSWSEIVYIPRAYGQSMHTKLWGSESVYI